MYNTNSFGMTTDLEKKVEFYSFMCSVNCELLGIDVPCTISASNAKATFVQSPRMQRFLKTI